ncbi:battenin-like isoform X2 [Tubulanus polymorphus]|uniref:battenin-like isoform X2 n=1 Tax=Tubulanus polymorphus TaxID=672921 RepID=UPI003DA45857
MRNNFQIKETMDDADDLTDSTQIYTPQKWTKIRNLVAFWIFGLCNNFAYVIMLSAAHDILKENERNDNGTNTTVAPTVPVTISPSGNSSKLIPECNPIGTGAILLADILPALIIKITAPLYMQRFPYFIRVNLVIIFAAASLVIVAVSGAVWISLLGVVCASISSGLGEITFLALSSHFDKNSVSTWSSGTGGAGIFGALSYAGLTSIGVTPRDTLFIMLAVPVILAFAYFVLVVKPPTVDSHGYFHIDCGDEDLPLLKHDSLAEDESLDDSDISDKDAMERGKQLSFRDKVHLLKPLLKWMIPLGTVYFAEYFINQCLHELIAVPKAELVPGKTISVAEQYRWFQVDYQLGVFLSRSSVNLFQIRKIWIMAILQCLNIIPLMFQVFFKYIPSVWIIFAVILYEGLLGGCAYVNTFYMISKELRV